MLPWPRAKTASLGNTSRFLSCLGTRSGKADVSLKPVTMLLIVIEHPAYDDIPSFASVAETPDLKMRPIRMDSDAICCAAYVADWHQPDIAARPLDGRSRGISRHRAELAGSALMTHPTSARISCCRISASINVLV